MSEKYFNILNPSFQHTKLCYKFEDRWMICDIMSFSEDENERLCAMEHCLQLKRFQPRTARSAGQHLTHQATRAPWFNPIALIKAKIVNNFGLSECNRVK